MNGVADDTLAAYDMVVAGFFQGDSGQIILVPNWKGKGWERTFILPIEPGLGDLKAGDKVRLLLDRRD